ncbi:unnamed protein product, partial [Adineta steineri]
MGAAWVALESSSSISVMIIGSTGEGKSSLINLLVGKEKAPTGDGPCGVTFDCSDYETTYLDIKYIFSDTIGLNECDTGTVPHKDAIRKLVSFARSHSQGFNLLIFVMKKGRFTDGFQNNHLIFYETLFNTKVPCILYVSQCEHDTPIDAWYTANSNHLGQFHFKDV